MLGFCPCFLLSPSSLFALTILVLRPRLKFCWAVPYMEVPITEERLVNRLVLVLKVAAQRMDFTRTAEYSSGGCTQILTSTTQVCFASRLL